MIYLLLCIITSSLLMVIFKIAGKRNIDSFQIILVNYFIASLLGFSISSFPSPGVVNEDWFPFAAIIGILFIVVFMVISLSTRRSGLATTSVASRMSVIIPISFSIVYFKEELTTLKVTAIILALAAVFFTVYKKDRSGRHNLGVIILPLVLFFGSGTIDSLVKYTQGTFLEESNAILFSSTLFLIAAICGLLFTPFMRKPFRTYFRKDVLITGTILGIINLGSLYGIVMALESRVFESSIIFGINNIGIVLLSVALALWFFDEKLSRLNKAGVALSIISIIVLSSVR